MGKQKACLKTSAASTNIFLLPCPLKRGGPSLSRYITTLLPLLSLGSKESCNKGESLPPIPLPFFLVDVVLTVFKRDQALTLVGETTGLPRPAFHLRVTTSDGVHHLYNGGKMALLGNSALQVKTLQYF